MDHVTLHKKLSTFLSDKGRLIKLPDDLLCEVLQAWESWSGSPKEFYKSVGFSYRQMAGLIGKAKKLKRAGYFPVESFTEIKLEADGMGLAASSGHNAVCAGNMIELQWQTGKIIRFPQVELLVEFLKKAG